MWHAARDGDIGCRATANECANLAVAIESSIPRYPAGQLAARGKTVRVGDAENGRYIVGMPTMQRTKGKSGPCALFDLPSSSTINILAFLQTMAVLISRHSALPSPVFPFPSTPSSASERTGTPFRARFQHALHAPSKVIFCRFASSKLPSSLLPPYPLEITTISVHSFATDVSHSHWQTLWPWPR